MSSDPRMNIRLRPLAGCPPLALTAADALDVTAGDPRPLLRILSGENSMTAGLEWMDRARCAEVDPEIFFVEKGGSTRDAKRVCRSCEARPECLDYALEDTSLHGVWGGMSERERRQMRRQAVA